MNSKKTQYVTIKDAWNYFISNIWLFIISIILSTSIALVYVVITPPIYKRTASILIKSDEQRQDLSNVLSLDGSGTHNNNIDINNEINILLMPQLMEEVVKRLSLQNQYHVKFRGARWVDIYHNAPFEVQLDTLLSNCTMKLELLDSGEERFEITDLSINGSGIESVLAGNYGDTITTSYGAFSVQRVPWNRDKIRQERYTYSRQSVSQVTSQLSSALTVNIRSKNVSIIDISLTSGSRDKAEAVLNTLISVYNENWIKDKNLITISTTRFINDRVKIIEKELGVVDKNISNYKSENLLPDVKSVSNFNLQSSNEILREQVKLNNQLSMAQYILQYLQNNTIDNQLLPVNTGIEDNSIEAKISQYNELLMRKNNLLASSSMKNPIIADMVSELQSRKTAIKISINEFINTLNFQLENNRKEEIVTRNRLSQNPSQELYLLSTGREQMVKEQLYLFLLQKREENELKQAFTAYNTKVLSYAKGSNIPIEPKRNIILLMGLAVGIVLPIIILIIRESFNTVVRDKSDLKEVLVPYLGAIPLMAKMGFFKRLIMRNRETPNKIVVNDSRDIINESFRVVRTNLDFMAADSKGCRCIAITSINPKSGKSFVSLNLAASLALKESKTLIVDGDFRRGTLSEAVNSPRKGLVNYLNSKDIIIEDVIVKSVIYPTLDVLPMGIMPPNPTELMLIDKFATLVKDLRTKYDYILFDCPPVDIVSDAAIVEKQCDSTIFVVRAGLMEKEFLNDLEEFYTNKTYKNMSLLLNGVDYSSNRKYGYGTYGRYGDGSYYGYGNKNRK